MTPAVDSRKVLRDETVEARGRTAFTVEAGQTVRIVDLEGRQVADLVCFLKDDPAEKLCPPERHPGNAFKPTPLRVVLSGA